MLEGGEGGERCPPHNDVRERRRESLEKEECSPAIKFPFALAGDR